MEHFLFIFGPPAVGKATVGAEIAKITDLRLFHNHMTIEVVRRFFDAGPAYGRLVRDMRMMFFREFAASDLPGVIFTGALDFADPESVEFMSETEKIFADAGTRLCYLELAAPLALRLERNILPDRIARKPSKADTEGSTKRMIAYERECRFESRDGEFAGKSYTRLDTSQHSATEIAAIARDFFGF
jgi:shikimate kinase